MVKGVKIVKLSCITRVSYHYLTFNLDAFIKYILLITVHGRMVQARNCQHSKHFMHNAGVYLNHYLYEPLLRG